MRGQLKLTRFGAVVPALQGEPHAVPVVEELECTTSCSRRISERARVVRYLRETTEVHRSWPAGWQAHSGLAGGALATMDDSRLPDGHRFGRPRNGQQSLELEGPTGFVEAHYATERGALFVARSTTKWETITHLIRDTPDTWTYRGWSPSAEYRSGGRWVRLSEAPVAEEHHFINESDRRNVSHGRWRLAGDDSSIGFPVAAELCKAAIIWWDAHGASLVGESSNPTAEDFCSAFPRLSARREADDDQWKLIYSTDSAEWIRTSNGVWTFGKELSMRDRISSATMGTRLSRAWRQYSHEIRGNTKVTGDLQTVKVLEAVFKLGFHGTEFPLILALLPTLLKNSSRNVSSFDYLSQYCSVNAQAGYTHTDDSDTYTLYVQNDVSRWEYTGRWRSVPRRQILKTDQHIDLDQVIEACQAVNPGLGRDRWIDSEKRLASTIWVVTTGDEKVPTNFPIHDVVRGNTNQRGVGWRLTPWDVHKKWEWQYVQELDWERLMPETPFDGMASVQTDVHYIDQEFGALLEEYWMQYICGDLGFDFDPTWFGFLEWANRFS